MIKKLIACAALAIACAAQATAQTPADSTCANPKREFRGAWMHTIYQAPYKLAADSLKAYLTDQLDKLQAAGVNAVLFQVRPSADALYPSRLEPWSRFMTDNGAAPVPFWDPLQFMIDESHKRGMELHAWLNPYRVTTSPNEKLAPGHIYHKEPWRFVTYEGDKKMYFDPALPENRKFIQDVVMDIIERYDVDGIHFDDYFYPYPAVGIDFPDDASYAKYGNGMDRGDWRRKNVDMLIEGIHNRIKEGPKPWVRFGISPFGIYRNKSTDPNGSDTDGLQNYDALYADVLLWDREGWIDYLLPQLYWELEHKRASTLELGRWWNQAGIRHHLYYGQDVTNMMKHHDLEPSQEPTQLNHKMRISRQAANVQGNCWWPGYALTANVGGASDSLAATWQSTIALPPTYPWIDDTKPDNVTTSPLKRGENTLRWAPARGANRYVVYKFDPAAGNLDFDNPANIYTVTYGTSLTLTEPGIYGVRGLSHTNIEGGVGALSRYNPAGQ